MTIVASLEQLLEYAGVLVCGGVMAVAGLVLLVLIVAGIRSLQRGLQEKGP